ncbi:MAG: hypothetical protein R3B54_04690 [Bdellovibrionota bacterium]
MLGGIATLSFSIYLSHEKPLYYCARLAQYLGLEDWSLIAFMVPTVLSGSVALAWVLYHGIEKPALRWRERVCPKEELKNEEKSLVRLKTSAVKS